MASFTEGKRSFTVGSTDLLSHLRVKLHTDGTIIPAGDEAAIGHVLDHAKTGENVTVRFLNEGGSFLARASGAINQGAAVGGDADGKVQAGGTQKYIALGKVLSPTLTA